MEDAHRKLAFNAVYLAKKLHEVKRFNMRATEIKAEELMRAAEIRLGDLKPLSRGLRGLILDCACGYGVDMLAISWLDGEKELIGMDLAIEGLRRAREGLVGTEAMAHFVQADACFLPFRQSALDAVIISSVLHHHPLQLVKTIIAEVSRALRRGGFLLVREPCPSDEGSSLGEEISSFLSALAHLKEFLDEVGELGDRREIREALHRHFPAFGFGELYRSVLKDVLEAYGLRVLALDAGGRRRRGVEELLELARERVEGLRISGEEGAFLLAKLEELRDKASLIRADGPENMVLVKAIKVEEP